MAGLGSVWAVDFTECVEGIQKCSAGMHIYEAVIKVCISVQDL